MLENETSMNCYKNIFGASCLNSRQQAALTIANLFTIIGNTTANALAIYTVIKTGQISQITCKLVLALSPRNLLLAFFCQGLLTALFYAMQCSVVKVYTNFFSIFIAYFYFIFIEINFNFVFSYFVSSIDYYRRFDVRERRVC